MVKVGGRTAWRVSDNLFKTTPIGVDKGTKIGGGKIKDYLCVQLCSVFCDIREKVLIELIKTRPDLTSTAVGENLTDLKTATDLLAGGDCECECENIKDILTKVM